MGNDSWRRIYMKDLCNVMFIVGLSAYAVALFLMGTMIAEIFSDIGNAVMLITAVILLFRLSREKTNV